MIIRTNKSQDLRIQHWYQSIVRSHHAEECEPPGFTLHIEMGLQSHYEQTISAVCGSQAVYLGCVEVEFDNI